MKLWNVYTKRGFHVVRFLVEAETLESAIQEVFEHKFNRSGKYERQALIEGKTTIHGNELTSWSGYWFGAHQVKIYRSESYTAVPNWCKKFDTKRAIEKQGETEK